jgi:hypothetical protein
VRQLPNDIYIVAEWKKFAMFWRSCRACKVQFKHEPFLTIYAERDIAFPTQGDLENHRTRYFANITTQEICGHCAETFNLKKLANSAMKIEEFETMVDEMHKLDPPVPVHGGKPSKVFISMKPLK